MGWHDGIQQSALDQLTEDSHIMFADLGQWPWIARGFFMRVRRDCAMPWEMLAGGFHTGAVHPLDKAFGHH
ncbi:hypothetical protein D3C76_1443800 [compost metagenome]